MKAVICSRYGPPEVLRVAERDTPTPREREVLIRVRAAEVTKSDCELRAFRFPVKWYSLPLRLAFGISKPRNPVLGAYFSGEVAAVGSRVTRFKKGDALFGCARMRLGAYGEFVSLPDDYTLVPKPSNLTHQEAATVPLGGLNALHFLARAEIQPGERALINGAGGSIGSYGIQIAKSLGAEVTAVDRAAKESKLRDWGADHFIDYEASDFADNGQRYDVIFNMVAGFSYEKALRSLAPGGRYLIANPRLSDLLRGAFASPPEGKKVHVALAGELPAELRQLKDWLEAGTLRPTLDRVYPLEQAAEAHHCVETEQRRGCVALSVTQPATSTASLKKSASSV